MKRKSCFYYTPAKNTGTEQLETATLFKKIKYDYLENTIPQKQHFFFQNHIDGQLTMCKNNSNCNISNNNNERRSVEILEARNQ